jgi:hypothetical protein
MGVLRGGPGNLSMRLYCITRLTGYILLGLYIHCAPLLVGYPPTPSFGGFGRARVFFFIKFIFLLFFIWLRFLIQIWAIMILYLSVFSVGRPYLSLDSTLFCYFSGCGPSAPSWYSVASHLYHMSFCYFSRCGHLVYGWYSVSSRLGCGHLAPGWYSVGSLLYYISFCHLSGCGPLAPGWYSVGSHLY